VSAPAGLDHSAAVAELDRLAESGALDELWWALTGVLLSAAERLAPEATTAAETASIVAGLADKPEGGRTSDSVPTKKAAPLPGHGPNEFPRLAGQGEAS